jgi:hypothetical protein
MDNKPIHMWDPRQSPQHALTQQHHTATPTNDDYPTPVAIIKDDATPTQSMSHSVPHRQTCAQNHAAHVHLINSVITEALMPLIDLKPTYKYLAHSNIAATQALLMQTYGINPSTASQPNTASINLMGAIVDIITGSVLEYRHLIKSDTHKDIWHHSFANKLGRLFQGIRDIKGTNICFFIAKDKMPWHK